MNTLAFKNKENSHNVRSHRAEKPAKDQLPGLKQHFREYTPLQISTGCAALFVVPCLEVHFLPEFKKKQHQGWDFVFIAS